jgi:energy-coupling factor transport system permease protein
MEKDERRSSLRTLLEYRPGGSLVHRTNPVTKLVLAASLVLLAFLMPDFRGPLAMSVVLLGIAATAGILRRLAAVATLVTAPLAVALLVIQGLFYPGNETPLFSVGPVTFWQEGLEYALLVLFRVLVLVLAFLTVILTSHPRSMMVSLVQKGLSPKLAYVFLASLQFVPEMQKRALAISEAQQARGLDTRANLWRRVQSLTAMLAPLLTGALIATETRSLALEARGFNRKGPRTSLIEVPDRGIDRALRWAAVAVLIVAVTWKVIA